MAHLTPSALEIKAFDYDASAVKQIRTGTTTGTSGTASFTWQGTAYVLTFDSDLTDTNANFVTANAAAFLLRGVVLTSSVADLIMNTSLSIRQKKGFFSKGPVQKIKGVDKNTINILEDINAFDPDYITTNQDLKKYRKLFTF